MENKKLYKYQNRLFDFFIYFSWIFYFLILIGVSQNAPKYLEIMEFYVKIYISLFLIYRFNPFRKKIEFNDLDRKIAYSSGLFLFTTTAIYQILKNKLFYLRTKLADNKNSEQEK
jgi:hypothetical protein